MTRNSFLLVVLVLCAMGAWKHANRVMENARVEQAVASAATDGRAVVVYGRDRCGYTRQMLASLRARHIPMKYVDIDRSPDALHEKFGHTDLAGPQGYALPVVEVAGGVSMRPDPQDVIDRFVAAR